MKFYTAQFEINSRVGSMPPTQKCCTSLGNSFAKLFQLHQSHHLCKKKMANAILCSCNAAKGLQICEAVLHRKSNMMSILMKCWLGVRDEQWHFLDIPLLSNPRSNTVQEPLPVSSASDFS